jgi:hypothetical protein
MKQYDLDLPLPVRVMPFVVLVIFTLLVPILLVSESGAPRFIVAIWLGAVAWQWWVVLRIAYRVLIHDDGTLEWVALARRVKMRPEAVQSIAPDRSGSIGFFRLTYGEGKVRFINQVTGFHEIVQHIKSHNPGVVLRGC